MMRTQRVGNRAAEFGAGDMRRVIMHRDAGYPADGMVLQGQQVYAVDEREDIGDVVMEMRDGINVGAGAQDFTMQEDFCRRTLAGGPDSILPS